MPGQSLTPLILTTEGIFDLTSNLGSREDAQRRAHDTQPPLTNMLSMLIKLICDAAKRALIIVRAVSPRSTGKTRARPSPAFSTTSSSRTFSDLSISTTPQISHGSQR